MSAKISLSPATTSLKSVQTIELTLAAVTGAAIDAVDAVPGVRALVVDDTAIIVRSEGPDETTLRRAVETAGARVLSTATLAPSPVAGSLTADAGGPTSDRDDIDALLSGHDR